ncbi:hypothetical protein ACFLRN_05645 [Thermoproteota archaeon]
MVDEMKLRVSKPFSRFAVALGGFLIFIGIIVTGIFIIVLFGVVDFSIVETETIHSLSILLLFAIGLLDLVAGIILWRR